MRIALYSYDHCKNPRCGGGGAYRNYAIHRILSKKHDISFYNGFFSDIKPYKENGLSFYFLGFGNNYLLSRITYSIFATIHSLFKTTDLLIVDFSVFSPVFTAFFRPKKTIVQLHHIIGFEPIKKYGIIGILPCFFEKYALYTSRNMITSAEGTVLAIRRYNPHINIRATLNGVDDEVFNKDYKDNNFILSMGRLDVRMKGLDILISSFERIADQYLRHHLIIAGRGTEKDISWIKKRIASSLCSDRISLLINISETKKLELLGTASFVCMPSRFEGWNIIAIEAAASSKATLGTDIQALRETIQNGVTGILVPPENIDKLSEQMSILLSNKSLREKLGKNGYTWARQFTWEKVVERQEQFYNELFSKNR